MSLAANPPASHLTFEIIARLCAAVIGGNMFCGALVVLGAHGFAAVGLAWAESMLLAAMLAILIFAGVIVWAIAEPRLYRVTVAFPVVAVIAVAAAILSVGG